MTTITIPQKISKNEELVAIPRIEYDKLIDAFEFLKKREISEKDILCWSMEAKKLKRAGRLSVLHSLKDLR